MKKDAKLQRKTRTQKKVAHVSDRPRLSVFRSNKYCYAQIIDTSGKTILGLSDKVLVNDAKQKVSPVESAHQLGVSVAKAALDKKIKLVVFDKGRFAYHGRVRAVAEGAREGGLSF